MFSDIYLNLFDVLGSFFGYIATVASMPFNDFLAVFAGRTSLEFVNLLTGSTIVIGSVWSQIITFMESTFVLIPLVAVLQLIPNFLDVVLLLTPFHSAPTWLVLIFLAIFLFFIVRLIKLFIP